MNELKQTKKKGNWDQLTIKQIIIDSAKILLDNATQGEKLRELQIQCLLQSISIFSIMEAIVGDDAKEWKIALREEFVSFIKNDTWILIERPQNVKMGI